MDLVLSVASHVVTMDFGAKIAQGTPEQVRADPQVIAAYLGQDADDPNNRSIRRGAEPRS